jgi:hypothetical protein
MEKERFYNTFDIEIAMDVAQKFDMLITNI